MSAVHIQVPIKPAVGGKWVSSTAAEEVRQVVTGKGMINSIHLTNANAAIRYAWIFDNTSSAGTLLCRPIPLAIAGGFAVDLPWGIPFAVGIRVAASSTIATFTASAAADLFMTIGYALHTP